MKKTKKSRPAIAAAIIFLTVSAAVIVFFFCVKKKERPGITYPSGTCGGFALKISDKFDDLKFKNLFNVGESNITSPAPEDILTREKAYLIVSNALDSSEIISQRFIPVSSEKITGRESTFYNALYGNIEITDESSYDGRLLSRQMAEAECVAVEKHIFRDGHAETVYDFFDDDIDLIDFFDDTDKISSGYSHFVENVILHGIIPYSLSECGYGLLIEPQKQVTAEEEERIIMILTGALPADRPDIVTIEGLSDFPCVSEGENVSFRLSGMPLLYALKRFLNAIDASDSVFFGTSADNSEFALTFRTEALGMVCIPLRFCDSSPVTFVFSPYDMKELSVKLRKIACLLPSGIADEFVLQSVTASQSSGAFFLCGISFQFFTRDEDTVLYIGTVYEKG